MALRNIVSWLAVLLLCAVASAQPGPPATARAIGPVSPVEAGGQGLVAVEVTIAPGLHAQSSKPLDDNYLPFAVTPPDTSGIKWLASVYPEGVVHEYKLLGKLSIYEGTVIVFLPFTNPSQGALAPAGPVKVSMQMCDDKVCFPPVELSATIAPATAADKAVFAGFDWSKVGSQLTPANPPASATAVKPPSASGMKLFGVPVETAGTPLVLIVALLAGLIFNLMPCVLPVLPLKAAGFYEASQHNRARSLLLGAVFSAGIIATFAALALLILVGGQQWGSLFQQAWFVWGMVIVLVAMAGSMFGLWVVRVPVGLYTIEPKHDTLGGNFLFGILTALLSTPCTAPLFPAVLLWAAKQPTWLGVTAMVTVGVGMALPYFLLSAAPEIARKLPRTGPWSELIKQTMGFLILGTAAYLASQYFLPFPTLLWGVVAVAAVATVYLPIAAWRLTRSTPNAVVFGGIGAAALAVTLACVLLLVPAVKWEHFSDKALADARARNQPVLVKFTANWCGNCQYIEGSVYTRDDVAKALAGKNVLLLKVDITSAGAPGSELLRQLNPAGGIPLTALYWPGEPEPRQLTSIYTAGTLIEQIAEVK